MSDLLQNRLTRRSSLGLAAAFIAAAGSSRALAEDAASTPSSSSTTCSCGSSFNAQDAAATPAASPVATPSDLPEGALGDRIQWLLDLINGDPAAITAEAIAPEFSAEVLETVSAEDLTAVIVEVSGKAAPLSIQEGQIATLPETPPTTAVFRADGRDGVVVQITISVDPESSEITGLVFKPLGFTLDVPIATPAG